VTDGPRAKRQHSEWRRTHCSQATEGAISGVMRVRPYLLAGPGLAGAVERATLQINKYIISRLNPVIRYGQRHTCVCPAGWGCTSCASDPFAPPSSSRFALASQCLHDVGARLTTLIRSILLDLPGAPPRWTREREASATWPHAMTHPAPRQPKSVHPHPPSQRHTRNRCPTPRLAPAPVCTAASAR
jgi:hypothetical protein